MRQELLAILLVTGLMTSSDASAQNVAVPQNQGSSSGVSSIFNFFAPHSAQPETSGSATSNAAAPTPAAPLPQISPAPSTPVPPASSSAARLDPKSAAAMASIYMPQSQQAMYIQMDRQNLSALQDAMANLNQARSTLAGSSQSSQNKAFASMLNISPAQAQSSNLQMQASLTDQINSTGAQIQMIQNRLAIMQSGSIRMSDFLRLYGNGQ